MNLGVGRFLTGRRRGRGEGLGRKIKKAKNLIAKILRLKCCGDPTRTDDLQVMSLASYQLLHSAFSGEVFDLFPVCECKGIAFGYSDQMFEQLFSQKLYPVVLMQWVTTLDSC